MNGDYPTFDAINHDPIQFTGRVLKGLPRVNFDPSKTEHRAAYISFARSGRWPILFEVEWPNVTVPSTVERKLSEYACARELRQFEAASSPALSVVNG